MSSQDTLADRYGAPAPWRRRVLVAASVALGLAFLGWLAWTAYAHSTPAVDSELVTYSIDDEHEVTARVAVEPRGRGRAGHLPAAGVRRGPPVVGELSFTPAYGADQPLEETVRTERRATSVELVGCTAPGQPRPR